MSQSNEMRVLLADSQNGVTNAISLAARSCDLIGNERFGRDTGKRGIRQQFSCGARVLGEDISGGFNFYPTAAQLDWLIQRMVGDNISGFPSGDATIKETLPPIYAYVDKGPKNFRYDLCRIASLTLDCPEGDYLDVRVELVGSSETADVTWPATPPDIDCASEFVTADVTLNVASTAYPFKSLQLSIDNQIAANQQENNINRTIFEAEDAMIGVSGTFGYRTDTMALYRRGIDGDDSATMVLADGTDTYTFTFGNLKIPGAGPTVPESGEITMSLNGMAYATDTLEQLTIAKS